MLCLGWWLLGATWVDRLGCRHMGGIGCQLCALGVFREVFNLGGGCWVPPGWIILGVVTWVSIARWPWVDFKYHALGVG